jgi:hypothetical protein
MSLDAKPDNPRGKLDVAIAVQRFVSTGNRTPVVQILNRFEEWRLLGYYAVWLL